MVICTNIVIKIDSSAIDKIYKSEYYKENNFTLESKTKTTCLICLRKITKDLRYGLLGKIYYYLENCDHVFCFICIKHWRKSQLITAKKELHRLCPICGVESNYIIPCGKYSINKINLSRISLRRLNSEKTIYKNSAKFLANMSLRVSTSVRLDLAAFIYI
jgi:hypothetical protein